MNIRQVAFLAGVSVATVSRCINLPEKVSEETKKRVFQVMNRLDYAPNPSAKSLSTGCTKTVMCVVPTICNEFFNQILEGCQKVFGEAHYKMLVYSTSNTTNFWDKIDQRSIDGMILSGSGLLDSEVFYLDKIKVPYVLIENMGQMEDGDRDTTYVYSDDCEGVNLALNYLYAEGNRKFGVIASIDDYPVTERRLKAVREFFAKNPGCIWHMEKADYADLVGSYNACDKLMKMKNSERPTAIFAFNDMMAIAALRNLSDLGIKVPHEVEVIGFDGSPISAVVTPALSTIYAPNRLLGERASELLLEKLKGKNECRKMLFPVELTLRETTKNLI